MDDLQFRRQLLTDPSSKDEEFLAWIQANPSASAELQSAIAFDDVLKQAFEISVPEGLVDDILLRQSGVEVIKQKKAKRFGMFAIAASLFLSIGFGMQLWLDKPDLGQFVIQHFHHEPEAMLSTKEIAGNEVDWVFAQYDLKVTEELGKVTYIERCPMLTGTGIHMVLQTAQGAVTVFYMPGEIIKDTLYVADVGLEGYVVAAGKGAFALLGRPGQSLVSIERQLKQSISAI